MTFAPVPGQLAAQGEPTGVDPAYSSTLSWSYGAVTSTVTITPGASGMVIWIAGREHRLEGPQVLSFTTANGLWFVSYTQAGWSVSQTPWSIDANTAQVALIYVNTTKAAGLLMDERHGVTMDWATHARLHTVDGAQISSGGAITGLGPTYYPLRTSNPPLGAGDYAVASCVLRDEDIALTVPAAAEGGPYTVARRTGAGNLWTWETANTLPFFATSYAAGANYIQWNQFTAGAWQLTDAADSRWLNYYVFATDIINPAVAGYVIVPGQAIHTTLAAAQAESVLGLDLAGFPSNEFAPIWQVTYTCSSHTNYDDMPGRCAVSSAPVRLVGYKSSVSSSIVPTNHSTLSGRSDPSSHPASAIEFTPTATLLDTDVQNALANLASGIGFTEVADPAAPAANLGILYIRDNGAGKSQLCIRFNTGAVQVIATEP